MTVKRWIFRHHTAVDFRYFWQKIGVKFYPQWDIVAPSSPWILIKEILTSIAALYRLCDILPLWKISWKENGIPRSTYVFSWNLYQDFDSFSLRRDQNISWQKNLFVHKKFTTIYIFIRLVQIHMQTVH